MRTSIKALTGLAVSALAALTMALALAPAASANAEMQRGCPSGAFCIYAQNAYWNNNHPSYIMRPDFEHYDDHQWWNLVANNHTGIHKVFNRAPRNYGFKMRVTLNTGSNGAGPARTIYEGESYDLNLSGYHSVTLWWEQLTNNW